MTHRKPLHSQVVVVVGASSGLGRQVALDLAAQGASVVVAARRHDVLEDLANELRQLGARDALAVACDVADNDQVEHLVQTTVEHFGRIDTFMVMPGIIVTATIEQTTMAEFERTIDVMLLGYIRCTMAVLPVMRQQPQGGVIIEVASVLGESTVPLLGAYNSAKHGLVGFTRTLQMELQGSDIDVCLVMPGAMATGLQNPHARSKLGVVPRPIPPLVHPEVVARNILPLCTHPRQTVHPDPQSKIVHVLHKVAAGPMRRLGARFGARLQLTPIPEPSHGHDNVDAPMPEGTSVTGNQVPTRRVLERRARRFLSAAGLGLAFASLGTVFGRGMRRRAGRAR